MPVPSLIGRAKAKSDPSPTHISAPAAHAFTCSVPSVASREPAALTPPPLKTPPMVSSEKFLIVSVVAGTSVAKDIFAFCSSTFSVPSVRNSFVTASPARSLKLKFLVLLPPRSHTRPLPSVPPDWTLTVVLPEMSSMSNELVARK